MTISDVPLTDGRSVRVHDTGPLDGPGPTLLWHHGSPQTGALLDPLVRAAAERGLRLLSYARPSYGGSTPQPGRTVASAAGDVEQILDALGIDTVATMGASGGGPHALACAALLPERVSAGVCLAGIAPLTDEYDWYAGMVADGGLRAAAGGRAARAAFAETDEFDENSFIAHQLMWAAPIGFVLLALSRRWYASGAAALVLLLVVVVQAPLYRGADVPAGGVRLTVLQANLRIGSADPADVVHAVTDHHADVLMTEELTIAERRRLIAAGLSRRLPYRFDAALPEGGGGLAIWSRFPLSDEHNYPGFDLGVLSATARISPTRSVTVVAVHLLPPYPYPSAEWVREIGRLRPILRADAKQTRPTIVAGDFNATTDNAQFRSLLTDGLQDAAEHSGAGYLSSYPSDRWFPPVIAIDHVLTRHAPAVYAATIALPGSDHRGLLVHVRLDG